MQFSNRVRIENDLFYPYGPYGSTTRNPLHTGKAYKNILSPLNDMHFSDRVRIENDLFHPYGPYGSTTRNPLHTGKAYKIF